MPINTRNYPQMPAIWHCSNSRESLVLSRSNSPNRSACYIVICVRHNIACGLTTCPHVELNQAESKPAHAGYYGEVFSEIPWGKAALSLPEALNRPVASPLSREMRRYMTISPLP